GLAAEGVVDQFGHFFVVKDAGLLVGLCGLEVHGEDGLLRSLVVASTYRGEGLAGLLVNAVLSLARKMELRAVYLLTTTARSTFDRLGFTPCARADAPAAIRESGELRAGCPVSWELMLRPVAAEGGGGRQPRAGKSSLARRSSGGIRPRRVSRYIRKSPRSDHSG